MEYWSWWMGALGLGTFAILFNILTKKPLGVSGSWLSIASRKEYKDLKKAADVFDRDQDEVKDDLLAMTMAEFGQEALDKAKETTETTAETKPVAKVQAPTHWSVHVVFLLCMTLGSFIAISIHGEFKVSYELSAIHTQIFNTPGEAWIALFFGGIMVGFGTQMAGGCTSGHGLSGCSQLVPASLFSTVIFMGSAIALSFVMKIVSLGG